VPFRIQNLASRAAALLLAAISTAPLAQGQAPALPTTAVQPILQLRLRAESSDWFDQGPEGRYGLGHALARFGATHTGGTWSWRLEGAAVAFVGLPTDAVQPAPAGALGLGAVYYASNDRQSNPAAVFLRQGWLRWARAGQAVRLGRFEFSDGLERAPKDPSLLALKTQRVGQRLIGPFGFSPVQRAFDGGHYTLTRGATNLTLVAARPTVGAFRARAQEGLDVDVAYAALGRGRVTEKGELDARLFALWYADRRGTVPTDNRPLALRQADRGPIRVATFGGHVAGVLRVGESKLDGLVWGAVQTGDWGALAQRADALAIEGGLQHQAFPWALWLRGGWLRTSGDANASDARHGTFFQVTPTPRGYARFPFYNLMNSGELFATASVKPSATVSLRAGVHAVSLTEPADLWYLGGGAFERGTFGYVGRPASGASALATVTDLSLSWQARRRIAVELYAAHARGGEVIRGVYGGSGGGSFLFAETTISR